MKFDAHNNLENPEEAYPNDLINIDFVHHTEFGKWMMNSKALKKITMSH